MKTLGYGFGFMAAVIAFIIIMVVLPAKKNIDNRRQVNSINDTRNVSNTKKANSGTERAKLENRAAQKRRQLQKSIGKSKSIGSRYSIETKNYLIVDIQNHESDLSIGELQNLYNK